VVQEPVEDRGSTSKSESYCVTIWFLVMIIDPFWYRGRDEMEEEVRAALLERQAPELVHDEELGFRIEGEPVCELTLRLRLREGTQQRDRAGATL
jgi:hypothetical protein